MLAWMENFHAKTNDTRKKKWRKNFLTSFREIFWGPKSSQNGEVRYKLDHYIIFHPSQWILSRKCVGISSWDIFYWWAPIWQDGASNLPRVFWGFKLHWFGLKLCTLMTHSCLLLYIQLAFQRQNNHVN